MVDTFTVEQRSRNMAAIRSRGNRTTENALRFRLVRYGISGWELCSPDLEGKPDFVFPAAKLVVFVDGCHWHGCPKCYRPPASNTGYWLMKFKRNRARDRVVSASLRRKGWKVLRIWEHEMERSPLTAVERIRRLLGSRPSRSRKSLNFADSVAILRPSSRKHEVV
jgi:DNA mismatch endonuclease (patch repair protein)